MDEEEVQVGSVYDRFSLFRIFVMIAKCLVNIWLSSEHIPGYHPDAPNTDKRKSCISQVPITVQDAEKLVTRWYDRLEFF